MAALLSAIVAHSDISVATMILSLFFMMFLLGRNGRANSPSLPVTLALNARDFIPQTGLSPKLFRLFHIFHRPRCLFAASGVFARRKPECQKSGRPSRLDNQRSPALSSLDDQKAGYSHDENENPVSHARGSGIEYFLKPGDSRCISVAGRRVCRWRHICSGCRKISVSSETTP